MKGYNPLQPHVTMLPLFAGQDSSIDPRVLSPGFSAIVENGRLTNRGQVQKRYGFTSMPAQDSTGGTISAGAQVFSAGNNLFQSDGATLRVWSPSLNQWVNIGRSLSAPINSIGSSQSIQDVTEVSSAANVSLTAVMWVELSQVYLSVTDNTSNTQIIQRRALGFGSSPNVIQYNNILYLFFITTAGSLVNYVISSSSPTNLVAGTGLPVPMGALKSYDVTINTQTGLIEGVFDASTAIGNMSCGIYSFSTNGTATLITNRTSTIPYAAGFRWSCVYAGNFSNLANALVVNLGASSQSATISSGFGSFWTLPAGSATALLRIAGAPVGGLIFAEASFGPASGTQIIGIQAYSWVPGGPAAQTLTAVGQPIFASGGNMRLASRAFTYNGVAYVWALADAGFQSQYMLIDQTGAIVARSAVNGAGAPWDGIGVSVASPGPDSANVVRWAERVREELRFDSSGQAFSTIGVAVRRQSFGAGHAYSHQFDGVSYISGPLPLIYDQATLTEWGFAFYPTITATSAAGGGLTGGTYFLAAVYSWYDATGKLWRSPTSLITEINNVPANGSIQVTIPYLFGTLKQGVQVEIYCSANIGGQTGVNHFKVASIANPASPGASTTAPPVTSLTFSIAGPDTAIQTGELLYTDGGLPSYTTPPALSYMSSSSLRLYGIDSEANQIAVTSPASPGSPLNFVETQEVNFESGANPLIACAVMNGQLYAASSREWFATNADTNDLSAALITFSPPRKLPYPSGIASAASLLLGAEGLYYQSTSGIRLLALNEVGLAVGEAVKNYTEAVLDVYLVPSQQQIRFVQASRTLCYDYVNKVWVQYAWANAPTAVSGCRYGDIGALLTPDGVVRLETVNVFKDDNYSVTRRIETPWFRPGGFPGWGRTWRFMLLGGYLSQHTLQVRIAYEDDPTWIDTLTISSEQCFGTPAFGGGLGTFGRLLPNGPGNPFGINPAGNSYKFEGIMPRTKAGSFKFEFSEVNSTGADSVLNYLALAFGVYPNLAQVPTTKKFG